MNPYLTIPLSLPGDPAQNLEDKEVQGKILPAQVLAYHEGYAWGICIYLSTGQAFLSPLTVAQYEEMVRKYWVEIAKRGKTIVMPGSKSN